MGNYKFVCYDKQDNELTTINVTATNIKDARLQRESFINNIRMNDLHKVKIIKK